MNTIMKVAVTANSGTLEEIGACPAYQTAR